MEALREFILILDMQYELIAKCKKKFSEAFANNIDWQT